MKQFFEKHPILQDVCDTALALISGSFALIAVAVEALRELLARKEHRA